MRLRVAGTLAESTVNGPGRRSVVHLQGCTLGCPACFNPETHAPNGGRDEDHITLATWLAAQAVDGVTISGGEPFQQARGLALLVMELRRLEVASIMVFTGYDLTELAVIDGAELALAHIDVLVAGRYRASEPTTGRLVASENQRVHFLTDRHGPEHIDDGQGGVEITILPDGRVVMTGFPPPALRRAVRALGE